MTLLRLTVLTLTLSVLVPALPAQTLPNRVAVGEVSWFSAVLWSRASSPTLLRFELSTDPSFATVEQTRYSFVIDPSVPAKQVVAGLVPGTQYHYRVRSLFSGVEDTGKFRTPHLPNVQAGLSFGVTGDSRGDLQPYNSVSNVPAADLDFFVTLGDTIYADVASPILPGVAQTQTLAEYRAKHQEVYSSVAGLNGLGDVRASTAWWATIDDHEVTNDFSGGASPLSDPRFDPTGNFINETNLYDNGVQAFVEYNPMLELRYGATGDARTAGKRKLYRAFAYGKDAAVFMLDARSFRDEALPEVTDPTDPAQIFGFLSASFDPSRTMLGRAQVDELKANLSLAQQVGIIWKFVMVPEPIQNLGVLAASDRFDGYMAERAEILDHIISNNISNVVFVAADFHGTLVNNLTYQQSPLSPQVQTSMFEVITGAVAYDPPFGPTIVGLAAQLGFITPAELAIYNALPFSARDGFVETLINTQLTAQGLDPLGLQGSLVPATLLQGGYVATHTYGWTQFDIDAQSSDLTITTYGVNPAISGATPSVVSQFRVTAQ